MNPFEPRFFKLLLSKINAADLLKRLDLLCENFVPWRAVLKGASAMHPDQRSSTSPPVDVADEIDQTALETAMRQVPLGAAVLAGSAVALLVLGYLLVYILVFIPRGTVG